MQTALGLFPLPAAVVVILFRDKSVVRIACVFAIAFVSKGHEEPRTQRKPNLRARVPACVLRVLGKSSCRGRWEPMDINTRSARVAGLPRAARRRENEIRFREPRLRVKHVVLRPHGDAELLAVLRVPAAHVQAVAAHEMAGLVQQNAGFARKWDHRNVRRQGLDDVHARAVDRFGRTRTNREPALRQVRQRLEAGDQQIPLHDHVRFPRGAVEGADRVLGKQARHLGKRDRGAPLCVRVRDAAPVPQAHTIGGNYIAGSLAVASGRRRHVEPVRPPHAHLERVRTGQREIICRHGAGILRRPRHLDV